MASKKSITVGLKCDSTDYDKKLAAAKKKTKSFGQESVEMFKGIAAAVAGSKAAMEVFNRVIASSQTIGDKYAQTMHTAKSAVDQFVYSIANADFSRFNMGLSDIITKSREAYNALDQLGNTQISYNYITGRNRAALRENLLKVRDVNLPMSEREAALSAAQGLYEDIRTQTNTYKATTEKYIKAALAEVSGLMAESIQMEDFVSALMVDIGTDPAAARKMVEKQYKAYKDAADAISAYGSKTTTNAYGQMVANPLYDPERAKADMAALNESNRSLLVAYNLLFRYTDEELQKLTGYLTQADNASYAVGEFATQIREAGNSLNQPIKPGTVGSALTGEQLTVFHSPNVNSIYANDFGRKRAAALNPYYEEGKSYGAVKYNLPIIDVPIISDDIIEESLPQVAAQAARVAEESYSAADGIYAISDALGNLSGIMDDQTAKWFDWGVAMLGAIGQFAGALSTGNAGLAFSSGTSLLGGLVSMPSIGGELKLRVQGSDLVGSINNYNKIKGRSY